MIQLDRVVGQLMNCRSCWPLRWMLRCGALAALILLWPGLVGCCGTFGFDPASLPETVSFDLRIAPEVVAPVDQPPIDLPMAITNTSESCLCFGRLNINGGSSQPEWSYGLVPVVRIEPAPGSSPPVDFEKSSVQLNLLSARSVGRSVTIRDPGIDDPAELDQEYAPSDGPSRRLKLLLVIDGSKPVGTKGTLHVVLGFRRPDAPPDASLSEVRIPIDVELRRPGMPLLVARRTVFPSQIQEPQ